MRRLGNRDRVSTVEFLAEVAIAQQFGRPRTLEDQAWIQTLFAGRGEGTRQARRSSNDGSPVRRSSVQRRIS